MSARIAVIGAGPSGLAAVRALDAAGLDAVAFERGARIGGVWTLEERPTAAYRSLHLITSKARTEFQEFPMPDDTPDYPSRGRVGRYLESYVDHFGLRDRIRLNAPVTAARRTDRGWDVDGERFDVLVVASGHNEEPKWPDPAYPGEFAGDQLHALDYEDPEPWRGKNVMVVGLGNSGVDIATDFSRVARQTFLSVRRGSWIIPKRLLGKPADQVIKPWAAVHVPWRIRQPLSQALLRITVGKPESYGLPRPERGLFQAHPTINDMLLSEISHGRLTPKPGIERLDGGGVVFRDGTREQVDAIVWCTGYRVTLPFLDPGLTGPRPEELPLWKRIFHPELRDLFFIGFMQSTGSAFPIVERQAQLLAAHLTGRFVLPSDAKMRSDVEQRVREARRRWGDHGRPWMRVDFDRYMHELGLEQRKATA